MPPLAKGPMGRFETTSHLAVVVFGIVFCTLLTLLIVPAFYGLLARNTRSPEYVARLIRKLQDSVGGQGGRAPAS